MTKGMGDVKLLCAKMVEDNICTSEENNIEIYEKIAEQFEGLADLFYQLAEKEEARYEEV